MADRKCLMIQLFYRDRQGWRSAAANIDVLQDELSYAAATLSGTVNARLFTPLALRPSQRHWSVGRLVLNLADKQG